VRGPCHNGRNTRQGTMPALRHRDWLAGGHGARLDRDRRFGLWLRACARRMRGEKFFLPSARTVRRPRPHSPGGAAKHKQRTCLKIALSRRLATEHANKLSRCLGPFARAPFSGWLLYVSSACKRRRGHRHGLCVPRFDPTPHRKIMV
jgi:hypothetical protein